MKKIFQDENTFYISFIPPSKANKVKINSRVYLKTGKRYIIPKNISVKINKVIWELQKQNKKKKVFFDEPVYVNILFILPNERRRDLDNIMKTLGDCLVYAGIIKDDNLIYKQTLEKVIIKDEEGVIIYIDNYKHIKKEEFLAALKNLQKYKRDELGI